MFSFRPTLFLLSRVPGLVPGVWWWVHTLLGSPIQPHWEVSKVADPARGPPGTARPQAWSQRGSVHIQLRKGR